MGRTNQAVFSRHHPTRFEKTLAPLQTNHLNHWNWFHTLSERKPPVKSESSGTNGTHRFSNFLPQAPERQSAGHVGMLRILSLFWCARLARGRGACRFLSKPSQAPERHKAVLSWKQFQEKQRFGRLPKRLPSA